MHGVIVLSMLMLNVILHCHLGAFHYAERHYSECHLGACHYAERHYAEGHSAESFNANVGNK